MIGQNKTSALCSYCETYAFVEVSLKIHNQKLGDSTGFFFGAHGSQKFICPMDLTYFKMPLCFENSRRNDASVFPENLRFPKKIF